MNALTEDIPTPIDVTSWPQVAALALAIFAFVVFPAVLTWFTQRTARAARSEAAEAKGNTEQIAKQFKNNGGSTVKDQLDRIERLYAHHITTEAEWRSHIEDRLDALDRPHLLPTFTFRRNRP